MNIEAVEALGNYLGEYVVGVTVPSTITTVCRQDRAVFDGAEDDVVSTGGVTLSSHSSTSSFLNTIAAVPAAARLGYSDSAQKTRKSSNPYNFYICTKVIKKRTFRSKRPPPIDTNLPSHSPTSDSSRSLTHGTQQVFEPVHSIPPAPRNATRNPATSVFFPSPRSILPDSF